MRIGIDCRTILRAKSEFAGVGHYTLFLVKNLLKLADNSTNEFILFFDQKVSLGEAQKLIGKNFKVKFVFLPTRAIPFVSAHIFAAKIIAAEHCDVFHSPDGHLPYFYSGPSVITIHDLAILRHPEWFPESAFERFISTKILLKHAIKKAKLIIVPSKATARDLKFFYQISEDRIRVIPLASTLTDQISERQPEKISDQYLLFIGTIEPRKNIMRLLEAFQIIHQDFPNSQLVLAGKRGWKDEEIIKKIEKTQGARYLGYVSLEEKQRLLEGATVFVWPSLYEGFGLPVLEAMSVGTPVITSNIDSLKEVVGEAALLVDPLDTKTIVESIRRVLQNNDFQKGLKEKSLARSAEFSWPKTTTQTLEVYKEKID